MRATILPRAPRRRGLITGLVTASVLTLSLLAGGTALGSQPELDRRSRHGQRADGAAA